MIEEILLLISIVPMVLGVSEILHWLKLLILAPEKRNKVYNVIFLDETFPQQQIAFFAEKYLHKNNCLVALCDLVREEDFEECRDLADKNDIIFCFQNELMNRMKF